MTDEERTGVRRMINQTIERLQKASVGANHMGSRYSRLLQLLWRKHPKANGRRDSMHPQSIDNRLQGNETGETSGAPGFNSNGFNGMGMGGVGMPPHPPNTFSWLDLGATWTFATQTDSVSGSGTDLDDVSGVSPFGDINMLTDYALLDVDNPNLIF